MNDDINIDEGNEMKYKTGNKLLIMTHTNVCIMMYDFKSTNKIHNKDTINFFLNR